MSSKRKLDIMEIDFDAIQNNLLLMSKRSLSDSKSFLLMVKSLAPNSIRLKLMEYQLAKENEDAVTASQLICQLYNAQEDISKEIETLFTGLLTNPCDKICSEIVSRLPVDVQSNILKSYFKDKNDPIAKADVIVQLLNSLDVQFHSDSICFLLDLVYRTLQEAEHLVLEEERTKNPVKSSQPETRSPNHQSSRQSESYKLEDLDEGEEGEVIGDDDEEDESLEDREDEDSNLQTNPCSESILNVYRFKIACEILPIAAKICTSVKIEKKLLYMIASYSLSFLSTYLTSLASVPEIRNYNSSISEHLIKNPQTYFCETMTRLGCMFQWNTSLSRLMTPMTPIDLSALQDALNQLDEWISEIKLSTSKPVDKECSSSSKSRRQQLHHHQQQQRRRSSIRKSDSWHDFRSKSTSLAFQTCCSYWFLLIRAGWEYLSSVRPKLLANQSSSKQTGLSCFPLDLVSHFGPPLLESSSNETDLQKPREAILLEVLYKLFRLRTYSSSCSSLSSPNQSYTFGCMELDEIDKLIRPSASKSQTETTFEMILRLDFVLAGLTNPSTEIGKFFGLIDPSTCPNNPYEGMVDQLFLEWWFEINRLSTKVKNKCNKSDLEPIVVRNQLVKFMKRFESICSSLTHDIQKPIEQGSTFSFVPLTQQNITYLATKLLNYWLCHLVKQSTNKSNADVMDAASIACVLCQVDTPSYPIPVGPVRWDSPFCMISHHIETSWSLVRENFAKWLTSGHRFLFDVGLLCRLAEFESIEAEKNAGLDRQSFAAQCMTQIQSGSSSSTDCIMEHFISSESDRIIQCFVNLI